MKRIALFGILLATTLWLRTQFSSSEEKIIKAQLVQVMDLAQTQQKLNPIDAFKRAQKIKDFLTGDFELIFAENEQVFTVQGAASATQKLAQALISISSIKTEVLSQQLQINGAQAEMLLEARGKFKISNKDFSEVRRLNISWLKNENSWRIQRIEKIKESFEP